MACEQKDRATAGRYAVVLGTAPDERWLSEPGAEPSLDELLDDPIMGLLWRADRLEPVTARAAVIGLRAVVRRVAGRRLERTPVEPVEPARCSLAA